MSNRINPLDQGMLGKIGNKIGESGTAKTVDANKPGGDRKASVSATTSDTVELTSGGKLLERLEKTLADIPEIDRSRVEAVKAQIESGEFQIDADKIAEAMLRLDQEIDGQR